jgi:hypothetical protein
MSLVAANIIDSFTVSGTTQSLGTVITAFVPPYTGAKGGPRKLFTVDTSQPVFSGSANYGKPNWWGSGDCFTHVTDFNVQSLTTQHTWVIMRPLNWSYFTAAIAKNTTAIPNTGLKWDPGVYSTKYAYPTPGGTAVPAIADAAISSTNKYVMYQLSDGTWKLDTITSGTFGSSLTLTTGTPNITGITIPQYSPLFYFGASSLSDPATGVNTVFYPTISTTQQLQSNLASLFNTLHRGDPLVFLNANATAADILSGAWGVYTKDW